MADQSDAVLAYWSENRQQLRQSEDQRASAQQPDGDFVHRGASLKCRNQIGGLGGLSQDGKLD